MKCTNCGLENPDESKFCGTCGTPLLIPVKPKQNYDWYVPIAQRTFPLSFDQELEKLASRGWQILSRTETSAQLKKSKEWSKIGILLFVVLPLLGGCIYFPIFGIAIIGFIFVFLDYLIRKDRLEYVTIEQLSQEGHYLAKERSRWTLPLIIGGILILLSVLCLGGLYVVSVVTR
jgi:hypothetical protein